MWFSIAGYRTEDCIRYGIVYDGRYNNSCVYDRVGEGEKVVV